MGAVPPITSQINVYIALHFAEWMRCTRLASIEHHNDSADSLPMDEHAVVIYDPAMGTILRAVSCRPGAPSLVGKGWHTLLLRGGRRGFDPRQLRRTKRAFFQPLAI